MLIYLRLLQDNLRLVTTHNCMNCVMNFIHVLVLPHKCMGNVCTYGKSDELFCNSTNDMGFLLQQFNYFWNEYVLMMITDVYLQSKWYVLQSEFRNSECWSVKLFALNQIVLELALNSRASAYVLIWASLMDSK